MYNDPRLEQEHQTREHFIHKTREHLSVHCSQKKIMSYNRLYS